MKQKKLIFNFFVNRNWKKLTDSRKSHRPIETLSGPCSRGRWNPGVKYIFLSLHDSIYNSKHLWKSLPRRPAQYSTEILLTFLGSPLNALVIFWSMPFLKILWKKKENSKLFYCSFLRGKGLTQSQWGIKMHLRMAESFFSLRVSLLAGSFVGARCQKRNSPGKLQCFRTRLNLLKLTVDL